MKRTAKRLLLIFLCLFVFIFLLGCGAFFYRQNYVTLNGRPCSRKTEQLDLSGKPLPDLDVLAELKNLKQLNLSNTGLSLGEHEWLQRQLPDCDIQWQVIFQGKYYYPDVEKLTISALNESDIVLLEYLPELTEIDARQCRDYGPLGMLVQRFPDCRVLCSVELGDREWDQDTTSMELWNADGNELLERLPVLSKVERVALFGELPQMNQLMQLRENFPDVQFSWKVQLGEMEYPDSQEHLDFTLGKAPATVELTEKLWYFPELKSMDFRGSDVPEDERQLLQDLFPQTEITWECEIGGVKVPGGTEVLDLSGNTQMTLQELRENLPYLPGLKKVILCDCGFENEELAKLNEELTDVRVVWSVTVGGRKTRTDETYFAPNKWGIKLDDENIYDLRYCTDMVCVDIGHMHDVTNCEWAAFMPELKFLILADGMVKDLTPLQNLKKLKFLELFLTPVRDLSPLVGCTALEDLNLCYVYTDPKPIQEMTWLKRLWWSGCWPAKNLLEKKLTNTEMNFSTASSTGEGWREGKLYYEMRDFIGMGYMKG